MNCKMILAAALMLSSMQHGIAQSLEDLNIQIHGYATQGFLYTTANNIFTTNSSDGSPAWTDAVISLSSEPLPKLRIAVQARYFLLGNYGNNISVDYAMVDYRANDRFGLRFGKVKTPWGLFNEIQDVDPSYLWALLPEGIYPIDSRSSFLAHYGGVVYGTIAFSKRLGKLEYRAFGGEGVYSAQDGYFSPEAEAGFNLPNNIQGPLYGGALHWRTPIPGLMVGASALKDNTWSAVYTANGGATSGTETLLANTQPNYFVIFEKDKLMVAYEYERSWGNQLVHFSGSPNSSSRNDDRSWYGMASYKVTSKLTAGVYDSQNADHQAPVSSDRHYNEWVVSSRYDFNQLFYAKAEEHFIKGTGLAFDDNLNSNLQPNSKLTVLKVGVSF
jgi:hypothetical protein